MALISCPECNKDISEKASSCPQCGCPFVGAQASIPDVEKTISCPACGSSQIMCQMKASLGVVFRSVEAIGAENIAAGRHGRSHLISLHCQRCQHSWGGRRGDSYRE